MVGPSGKVIAVDGSGDCVKAAHRNRELNRADNLIIRHAAVAEHSGTVRFVLDGVSAVELNCFLTRSVYLVIAAVMLGYLSTYEGEVRIAQAELTRLSRFGGYRGPK